MEYNIALIKGDGIGPEVIDETIKVLNALGGKYGHGFNYSEALAGGAAYDVHGVPLPEETVEICKASDSVLLGAVGGPKWDTLPYDKRPERALLGIRSELSLYANLRPAVMYESLKDACPLRPDLVEGGIDIMVVRELIGGIYFGERGQEGQGEGKSAWDTEKYSYNEVKRIAKTAFDIAMKRNKKLTSIDKANVLISSGLWREVVLDVAKEYPEVELSHMYVDNAAMQLVRDPKQFDVIVTSNMFGDILSDEASQITGSIGLLPSASLNAEKRGMYEPIHGSAPDIAGKNIANPIAAILSAAMMLKYSFGLDEEAGAVEEAVRNVLEAGHRTADIARPGGQSIGTSQMGDMVAAALLK